MAKTRGTPASIPQWWIDELTAAMDAAKMKAADLAARLAGTEDRNSAAFKAAKTLVSRFIVGAHRSEETADELRLIFKLPPYSFTPENREQAEAIEAAVRGAGQVVRALAISSLLDQVQAGEVSLDEAIRRQQERGAKTPALRTTGVIPKASRPRSRGES